MTQPVVQEIDAGAQLAGKYVLNLAEAIDQFVNAAVLLGDPHESISSHVGKLAAEGHPQAELAEKVINFIMLNNPQHCQNAAKHEAQLGDEAIWKD